MHYNVRKHTSFNSACAIALTSESSLGAFRITKDAKFLHADNEDTIRLHKCRMIKVSIRAHVRRYVSHVVAHVFSLF